MEKFHSVQKGFQKLGFTTDEIESIYSIIAAIIHLGDLQFIHADSRDNTERCILKNPKQVEPSKSHPAQVTIHSLAAAYWVLYQAAPFSSEWST